MIRSLLLIASGVLLALLATLTVHYLTGRPQYWQAVVLAGGMILLAFIAGTLLAYPWVRRDRPDTAAAVLVPLVCRMAVALAGMLLCVWFQPLWRNEVLLLAALYYLVALAIETALSYRLALKRGTDGSGT